MGLQLTIWDITDHSRFAEKIEAGFELVARADPPAEELKEGDTEREVVSINDYYNDENL